MIEKLAELDDEEWPFDENVQHVDKGEWAYTEGEPVVADYVGSCLVIGSMDPETNTGYLFHLGTLEDDGYEEFVDEAFDIISEGLGDNRRTYVTGTLPVGSRISDEPPTVEEVRSRALQNMEEADQTGFYQFDQGYEQERIAIEPEKTQFYRQVR
jgi:hypothetical protein